jgi:hypothetical protein
VETYQETGAVERAAQVAQEYLRRRGAWEHEPRAEDFAASKDAMGVMLDAAYRGGKLGPAEHAKARDAFLREWASRAAGPSWGRFIWFYVWAQPARSREEALEAVKEAERYPSLPVWRPKSLALGFEGSARFLSGDVDRGLDLLERGTRVCRVLSEPVRHTRLFLTLADAREQKGDKAGACAALRVVESRWGHALPKSVTLASALEHMRALGCARNAAWP